MTKGWRGVELREVTSKDIELHPWIFRCPKTNCYKAVACDTEEQALAVEADHDCPNQGGITKIKGSVTLTLVEDMWAKADKVYATIHNPELSQHEVEKVRERIRGICEMIAIFMPPHFTDVAGIGKELMKRKAHADAGEPYETPGLLGRRYEMPPPLRESTTNPPRFPTVRSSTKATKPANPVLTQQEKEAIKFAIEIGGFTKEQVAKTYKTSVEEVMRVI